MALYPGAQVDLTPAAAHGGQTPHAVVCHRTYGAPQGDYAVGKGARGGIGFHFLVWPDGQVFQFVDTGRVAWHAKGANTGTIGVEVSSRSNDAPMTDAQIAALGPLCAWISATHGIPLVHAEGGRQGIFSGYMDHAQVAGSDHGDVWHADEWRRIVAAAEGRGVVDMLPGEVEALTEVRDNVRTLVAAVDTLAAAVTASLSETRDNVRKLVDKSGAT